MLSGRDPDTRSRARCAGPRGRIVAHLKDWNAMSSAPLVMAELYVDDWSPRSGHAAILKKSLAVTQLSVAAMIRSITRGSGMRPAKYRVMLNSRTSI
jgi:hypothetical protein